MKVIYTLDVAIGVGSTSKLMAAHDAGVKWSEMAERLREAGAITIKRIRVEGDGRPESEED